MQSLIAAAEAVEGIDFENYNKLQMDSSCAENSTVPLRVAYPYPPPLAMYNNIVASRQLFMDTLHKLHDAMQTKFRIPVMGGKLLDLHRLFIEVTRRGGVEKAVAEKRWKEVKLVFNFPSSATNASFLLKKHYNSLLLHYERVYYSKATHWNPSPCDHTVLQQQVSRPPHPEAVTLSHELAFGVELGPDVISLHRATHWNPSPCDHTVLQQQVPQPKRMEITFLEAPSTVSGVIDDGKFENEYVITVKGEFKGFCDHQVLINQELRDQDLPTSTTAAKVRIAKLTPRRKKLLPN